MSVSQPTLTCQTQGPPDGPKFSQRQPIGVLPSLWNKWNKLIHENASRTHTKRKTKSNLLRDYPDVVRC